MDVWGTIEKIYTMFDRRSQSRCTYSDFCFVCEDLKLGWGRDTIKRVFRALDLRNANSLGLEQILALVNHASEDKQEILMSQSGYFQSQKAQMNKT